MILQGQPPQQRQAGLLASLLKAGAEGGVAADFPKGGCNNGIQSNQPNQ